MQKKNMMARFWHIFDQIGQFFQRHISTGLLNNRSNMILFLSPFFISVNYRPIKSIDNHANQYICADKNKAEFVTTRFEGETLVISDLIICLDDQNCHGIGNLIDHGRKIGLEISQDKKLNNVGKICVQMTKWNINSNISSKPVFDTQNTYCYIFFQNHLVQYTSHNMASLKYPSEKLHLNQHSFDCILKNRAANICERKIKKCQEVFLKLYNKFKNDDLTHFNENVVECFIIFYLGYLTTYQSIFVSIDSHETSIDTIFLANPIFEKLGLQPKLIENVTAIKFCQFDTLCTDEIKCLPFDFKTSPDKLHLLKITFLQDDTKFINQIIHREIKTCRQTLIDKLLQKNLDFSDPIIVPEKLKNIFASSIEKSSKIDWKFFLLGELAANVEKKNLSFSVEELTQFDQILALSIEVLFETSTLTRHVMYINIFDNQSILERTMEQSDSFMLNKADYQFKNRLVHIVDLYYRQNSSKINLRINVLSIDLKSLTPELKSIIYKTSSSIRYKQRDNAEFKNEISIDDFITLIHHGNDQEIFESLQRCSSIKFETRDKVLSFLAGYVQDYYDIYSHNTTVGYFRSKLTYMYDFLVFMPENQVNNDLKEDFPGKSELFHYLQDLLDLEWPFSKKPLLVKYMVFRLSSEKILKQNLFVSHRNTSGNMSSLENGDQEKIDKSIRINLTLIYRHRNQILRPQTVNQPTKIGLRNLLDFLVTENPESIDDNFQKIWENLAIDSRVLFQKLLSSQIKNVEFLAILKLE